MKRSAGPLLLATSVLVGGGCGTAATPAPTPAASLITASPSTRAATASPIASPTASPSVSTVAWMTYSSQRYRYAVDVPSDWTFRAALQDWPGESSTYPDDNAVDKWSRPTSNTDWVLMFVTTIRIGQGKTAADRVARLDDDNKKECSLGPKKTVSLDGASGQRQSGMCFGTDFIDEVAVGHDSRFYLIYLLSGAPFDRVSQTTYERFAGSFRFLRS